MRFLFFAQLLLLLRYAFWGKVFSAEKNGVGEKRGGVHAWWACLGKVAAEMKYARWHGEKSRLKERKGRQSGVRKRGLDVDAETKSLGRKFWLRKFIRFMFNCCFWLLRQLPRVFSTPTPLHSILWGCMCVCVFGKTN